jgi:hypothetical protein
LALRSRGGTRRALILSHPHDLETTVNLEQRRPTDGDRQR